MTPDDILANAERLIADARYLHSAGRSRSAATLIVVALEQFGSFVEELAREKYPNALVHMGIFGDKANAHAKRQDALAGHVYSFTLGQITLKFAFETFYKKTGCCDPEKLAQWFCKNGRPPGFTEEQKQRMKDNKEMKAATLLMKIVREGRLKNLREYGLYENSEFRYSTAAIEQVIDLTAIVRDILIESRDDVMPEPMQMAGINMPEGIVMDDEGKWRSKLADYASKSAR